MTHSLSSLSAVGRKRVRALGLGGISGGLSGMRIGEEVDGGWGGWLGFWLVLQHLE